MERGTSSVGRGLSGALLALAGLTLIAAGPAEAGFYDPPSELPKGHGKLIRTHAAGKLVRLDDARVTKKVLYTSKSPQGERIAVSGSVSLPQGTPPKGGWPTISWAHGTTGVADICAPSRVSKSNPAAAYVKYVDPIFNEWLRAGYAVARTDYPGLGTPGPHPYLIGKSEGRGVLDIVRAAGDMSRKVGDDFLIAGHSQGGQAALFGARYAEGWTPDLRLHGTVSYSPASHLLAQANTLPLLTEPSPLSALAVTILYGASTANSRIHADQVLQPEPLSLYPMLDSLCLPQLGQADRYGGIAPSELLQDGQPSAGFNQVLAKMNPAIETGAPIYLAQGDADGTVLPVFTDQLDRELRELGNSVDYEIYPGIDHGGIVTAAESDVLPWMKRQLRP